MNENGWVPREMILGAEAVARVPAEFLVQSDDVANPPMFFYLIEKFLDNSNVSQHTGSGRCNDLFSVYGPTCKSHKAFVSEAEEVVHLAADIPSGTAERHDAVAGTQLHDESGAESKNSAKWFGRLPTGIASKQRGVALP